MKPMFLAGLLALLAGCAEPPPQPAACAGWETSPLGESRLGNVRCTQWRIEWIAEVK